MQKVSVSIELFFLLPAHQNQNPKDQEKSDACESDGSDNWQFFLGKTSNKDTMRYRTVKQRKDYNLHFVGTRQIIYNGSSDH